MLGRYLTLWAAHRVIAGTLLCRQQPAPFQVLGTGEAGDEEAHQ